MQQEKNLCFHKQLHITPTKCNKQEQVCCHQQKLQFEDPNPIVNDYLLYYWKKIVTVTKLYTVSQKKHP